MNREEAKLILSLCRPGNADDQNDPSIAEARALLETDLELAAWFESEQTFDAQIADALADIQPPANLKADILAGMQAQVKIQQNTPTTATDTTEAPIPFQPAAQATTTAAPATTPRPWFQNPWASIAAIFAVLFVVAVVRNQNTTAPQYANNDTPTNTNNLQTASVAPDVLNFLSQRINQIMAGERSLDVMNPQLASLQAHLTAESTPCPQAIPNCLNNTPTLGCVSFDYNGQKLGMICFNKQQTFHLITTHQSTLEGQVPQQPQTFELNGQAFKIWQQGEKIYIIAVQGPKENLPEFI